MQFNCQENEIYKTGSFSAYQGVQNNTTLLKSHSPDTGLAYTNHPWQSSSALLETGNCTGCTGVTKETHVLSHPKGGSREKKIHVFAVGCHILIPSEAKLWYHNSPAQLQQPRYTEVLEISHLVQKDNGYTLIKYLVCRDLSFD